MRGSGEHRTIDAVLITSFVRRRLLYGCLKPGPETEMGCRGIGAHLVASNDPNRQWRYRTPGLLMQACSYVAALTIGWCYTVFWDCNRRLSTVVTQRPCDLHSGVTSITLARGFSVLPHCPKMVRSLHKIHVAIHAERLVCV